ncbi:MAG: hypothetical protein P9X22_00145 [Candidatus Zapsychrus exili]|nr:hypothetical protein [Candidatus Zapsychrus exili]
MLQILRKNGFASIMEVIVSSIVFLIAAFGILSTISQLRPQGTGSAKKLEAAYIGKEVIDDIRGQVDARIWDDPGNLLAVGTTHTEIIREFNVTWWLEDVPDMGARKLEMIIEYPE